MADYPPQEGHGVEGVQVDVPGVPGVVPKPVNNRRIGDARIEGDDIADGYPTKMLGICVASVWLIAAAAAPRNGYMSLDNGSGDLWDVDLDGPHTYCIVVGSVALTLCAIVLMLIKYKPEPLEKVICNIRGSPVKGEQFVAIFLVFWWAAAAAVGTFYSPFETNVGNGYFALWAPRPRRPPEGDVTSRRGLLTPASSHCRLGSASLSPRSATATRRCASS